MALHFGMLVNGGKILGGLLKDKLKWMPRHCCHDSKTLPPPLPFQTLLSRLWFTLHLLVIQL